MKMREESSRSVTLSDSSSNTKSWACSEIFVRPLRDVARAAILKRKMRKFYISHEATYNHGETVKEILDIPVR